MPITLSTEEPTHAQHGRRADGRLGVLVEVMVDCCRHWFEPAELPETLAAT